MLIAYPTAGSDLKGTLNKVSEWCKRRFRYVDDDARWGHTPDGLMLFGHKEHWETDKELENDLRNFGEVVGDCDAYAKLVWKCLRNLGVKSRLVLCTVPDGQGGRGGHLVCEAGGMILDNIQIGPTSNTDCVNDLGYIFLSKSGFQPGGEWTDMSK